MKNNQYIKTRKCPKCKDWLELARIMFESEDNTFFITYNKSRILIISKEEGYLISEDDGLLEEIENTGRPEEVAFCTQCTFWGFPIEIGLSNQSCFNYNPLVKKSQRIHPDLYIHLKPSHRCLGKTKVGDRCKRGAIRGKNRCNIHIKSKEWKELATKLGIPL